MKKMRNYRAMKPDKLERVIAELAGNYPCEAKDKCLDPSDVNPDLKAAYEAAEEKGLFAKGTADQF